MKCSICRQNEATIEAIGIVDGKKTNIKICSDCEKKYGLSTVKWPSSMYDNVGLGSLTSALYNLAGAHRHGSKEPEILQAVNKCPVCGMTYDMFASKGKLGCGSCYKTFHDRLLRPLKQIHGTYEHVGKIPERAGGELKTNKKLEELRIKLDTAIQKQEFERAAEFRDEINRLKGEM